MTRRSNDSYGLQRKEFSEKVGLTDRQVLHFCELHVFNPVRPDDAPNNRRYFTESDFKAAELIQMLLKLGHNPVEIGRIFEENNHDLDLILDKAIKHLKKRIRHDRNLVMAAEYAQTVGTSLFTFSDMSDSDIDKFANAIRKSEAYKKSKLSLRRLSSEEIGALNESLESAILRFAELAPILNDDAQFTENFYKVETLVDDFVSKYSEISGIDPYPIMLSLGAIYFFGDGTLCSNADEIGGVGTSEFMGLSLLMTWLKRMSRVVFPLVLLLNNQDSNKQTQSILNKLLKLFETDSIINTGSTDVSFSGNDYSASIGLVEVLFDFAKEFSSDQTFMEALYIDKNLVPSVQQFDNTLALLNEYANESLKRKEM